MLKAMHYLCAAALLATPAVSHAQASMPASATTPKGKRAEMKEEQKERKGKEAHPQLRKAMASLERAKKDLEKASSDYGGHKAESIKAIDEAIKHLKLAEESDKK